MLDFFVTRFFAAVFKLVSICKIRFNFRLSHSTPSSPRLLPRRVRDVAPPPPPPAPLAAFDVLEAARRDIEGISEGPSSSTPVNWKEKCLELQLELHRSRSQATRTRDMLRDKVIALPFYITLIISFVYGS